MATSLIHVQAAKATLKRQQIQDHESLVKHLTHESSVTVSDCSDCSHVQHGRKVKLTSHNVTTSADLHHEWIGSTSKESLTRVIILL